MKRRERVLKTIRHEIPDRVPIDLGVHFSTGISAFAYYHLRKHLGLSTDHIEVCDNMQMLARVDEDILEIFHCDCILLNPPPKKSSVWHVRDDYRFLVRDSFMPVKTDNGDWIFASGSSKIRMPVNGYFFDGDWLNLSSGFEEMIRETAPRAERIYKETDYFTMLMGFSGFFDGIEFACDMYTDPDEIIMLQERRLDEQNKKIDFVIEHLGSHIQAVELNSDLGMQNGPMLDPLMYERFCYPYISKFCRYIHDHSDYQIFLHSCGAIEPLLPYIIRAGVDILNPVQISADGMSSKLLKEKYGKDICFWGGGCDTQRILGAGTTDDVRQNVKELMEVFKPGGGFVFNQVHNIMGNVPPENIAAMLETAYQGSFYHS